ncbi:hypothetical protein ABEB36_007431 [Hypothenemus hampei]|uniref:Translin-associated protein X n=1 Tax=Hypothenemus hampei TaxID=57062 RepID=A0ABD1EUH1_HYPHA
MLKNKGRYRPRKLKPLVGKQAKELLETLDDDHLITKMFKSFAAELDQKHDRYERIVKLSRDITIESKRIIFLLHSINTELDEKKNSVLLEAESRLLNISNHNFRSIATELKDQDGYLYHRAFTDGMQEFIEALCLYHFTKEGIIYSWDKYKEYFQYKNEENSAFELLFVQYDFILGIADFTGELMRKCINTLTSGNVDDCFKLCNFVRFIYTAFLGLPPTGNKNISRKMYVLKQSLSKMELVCYNIQIRGSEVPKHMLLNVIQSHEEESDDGFSL